MKFVFGAVIDSTSTVEIIVAQKRRCDKKKLPVCGYFKTNNR